MGQTIWVDVEGRPAEEVPADNSIMLRLGDQLAKLSEQLAVARLDEFFDHSELAKEFGETMPACWFEPARALAAVSALRRHLATHPDHLGFTPTRSQHHWPGALMEELAQCEEALRGAAERGQRFRFLIVP